MRTRLSAYNKRMRLREEIFKLLGGEGETARVQYTVVDGKGGYFQNVKRLPEFSERCIVLRGARGAVRVEGNHLSLGKYCAGDVAVFGDIVSVKREA